MRGRCPRQQHRGLRTQEEVSRTEGASGPSGTLDALGDKGCGRQAKASDAGKARPWGLRAARLSPHPSSAEWVLGPVCRAASGSTRRVSGTGQMARSDACLRGGPVAP